MRPRSWIMLGSAGVSFVVGFVGSVHGVSLPYLVLFGVLGGIFGGTLQLLVDP